MKTSDLASFMARKVSPFLTVEVQGGTWSVKGLPGLLVGDRVMCLPTPDGRHVFVKPEASGTLNGIWADAVAHDDFGFLKGAPVLGGSVHRLTPEVRRDEHGSYLSGDRSPAMARAIAADIRRRALTEPGYLDHWKTGAAAVPPPSIHKTSPAGAAHAVHAPPAAAPAPRRSARLARPARAPVPATSARSRLAARRALLAAALRVAGASLPSRPGLGSRSLSLRVAMAALYGPQTLAVQGKPAICLDDQGGEHFQ